MASAVIGALRVNLGIDSAQFTKGLKNSQSTLSKVGKRMAAVGGIITGAMAAAAGGMALAMRGTLNAADDMAKASQKFGVPIEELSRLKHAADLSGVSFEGLGTGLRKLSQNMNDAANGTGEAKDAFEQMGISVTGADGKLKSSTDVLDELADKFAEMPDGALKTALAMDILGRSGVDLLPMLNAGSKSLQAMKDEADALGIVFTDKTAKAAEQFNDNLTRLGRVFDGIKTVIAAELAPVLADVSGWFAENGPMIVQKIRDVIGWFKALSPETKRLAGIMALLAAAVGPLLLAMGTLAIIVGAISAPVLVAVAAFAAVGVGITILVSIIQRYSEQISAAWATFKAWAADTVATIKGAVLETWNTFWSRLSTILTDVMEWISLIPSTVSAMAADVNAYLTQLAADIEAAFRGVIDRMPEIGKSIVMGLWDGIRLNMNIISGKFIADAIVNDVKGRLKSHSPSQVFHEIGEDTMAGLANGIAAGRPMATTSAQQTVDQILAEMGRLEVRLPEQSRLTVEAVGGEFSNLGADISGTLSDAFKGALDGTMSFKDSMVSIMTRLRDILIDQAFKPIENALSNLFSGGGGGGGGIFGKLLGGLGGLFGGGGSALPAMPQFAGTYGAGGTIPAGSWGIAGEAGPEFVHGPARVFSNADSRAMIGGGGDNITVAPVYNINGIGASPAQIEAMIDRNNRKLPGMIRDASRRGK